MRPVPCYIDVEGRVVIIGHEVTVFVTFPNTFYDCLTPDEIDGYKALSCTLKIKKGSSDLYPYKDE